jgi:threonine dehydratase
VKNEAGAMIPSAKEVEHARELLSRYFRPTRLLSAESLARCSGARVYLKIESDLPTGSFKPRGALNALLTTAAQRLVPGVVAASTVNHGAAVAYAARIAKVGATIFLPENPNPVKRARIVALRAKVIERGDMGGSATSKAAAEFARERGHYFLDDASDPLVPAGTATIAAEIFDEIPEPDLVFVPMGDTALIRGVASEAKRRHSGVRIIGVQAERAPAYALARVPPAQGIAAMQSINVVVLNVWFFTLFFGTAVCCLALGIASIVRWQKPGAGYLLVASLLYLVGTILVTIVCNVPLNDTLAGVDPASADGAPT